MLNKSSETDCFRFIPFSIHRFILLTNNISTEDVNNLDNELDFKISDWKEFQNELLLSLNKFETLYFKTSSRKGNNSETFYKVREEFILKVRNKIFWLKM